MDHQEIKSMEMKTKLRHDLPTRRHGASQFRKMFPGHPLSRKWRKRWPGLQLEGGRSCWWPLPPHGNRHMHVTPPQHPASIRPSASRSKILPRHTTSFNLARAGSGAQALLSCLPLVDSGSLRSQAGGGRPVSAIQPPQPLLFPTSAFHQLTEPPAGAAPQGGI